MTRRQALKILNQRRWRRRSTWSRAMRKAGWYYDWHRGHMTRREAIEFYRGVTGK